MRVRYVYYCELVEGVNAGMGTDKSTCGVRRVCLFLRIIVRFTEVTFRFRDL